MLAISHKIPDFLAAQQNAHWEWRQHDELSGQTVGIIGLGPIGVGIAQRCRAFGMRTLGFRRSETVCPEVDETLSGPTGLSRLLAESDWLVIAAALTEQSRALLGAEELAKLRPTARIVNIARGPLINEAALLHALQNQQLAGAILDVFDTEPLPKDHPFWTTPNVFITAHSSGWTAGLRRRQQAHFVANLERFLKNQPLEGVVEVARGY
jgi:phosphoglycerate dehydrogenase-like enzyme